MLIVLAQPVMYTNVLTHFYSPKATVELNNSWKQGVRDQGDETHQAANSETKPKRVMLDNV